ncbi:zinc finger protein 845-like isoform X2 [Lineus longissimus]|uniref:zinc finger protein 845-like isoform X2 n=1 Tax=Lineus longissimus TaxID=88925 RepID=UPI00315C9998
MHRPPHNPHSQNRGHQQQQQQQQQQQRNDRQDQGPSHNIAQHPQYRHTHPGHRPNDFTISDVLTQCIDSVMHDPTPQHLQNAMTTQADFAALLRPKPLNSKQNPKQAAMAAHIQSQQQNPKQAAMAAHVQSQQNQKHVEQSYPTYPGPHMDNPQMQMQQQNPGNHGNQQQNPGNHGNQQQNPGNHGNQQRQQDPEFPDFTRSDEDMDQSGRHGVQLQTQNQNPPQQDFRRQQVGNGRLNMNQNVVDVDPNTARVREAYQEELMRQTEPTADSDTESHRNPFAALQMPLGSEPSPPVQEKRGTDSPVDTVDETIAAIDARRSFHPDPSHHQHKFSNERSQVMQVPPSSEHPLTTSHCTPTTHTPHQPPQPYHSEGPIPQWVQLSDSMLHPYPHQQYSHSIGASFPYKVPDLSNLAQASFRCMSAAEPQASEQAPFPCEPKLNKNYKSEASMTNSKKLSGTRVEMLQPGNLNIASQDVKTTGLTPKNFQHIKLDPRYLKPFKCNICSVDFATIGELSLHQSVHAPVPLNEGSRKEELAICEKCSVGFKRMDDHLFHVSLHNAEEDSMDIKSRLTATERFQCGNVTTESLQCPAYHQSVDAHNEEDIRPRRSVLVSESGDVDADRLLHQTVHIKQEVCPAAEFRTTEYGDENDFISAECITETKDSQSRKIPCKARKSFSPRVRTAADGIETVDSASSVSLKKTKKASKASCHRPTGNRAPLHLSSGSSPIANLKFKPAKLNLQSAKSNSGWKQFICKTCGKSFAKKSTLTVHEIGHVSEGKIYRCNICSLGFFSCADCVRHEKIHAGEMPFACSHPQCGRGFMKKSALTKHEFSHSSVKTYKCKHCGRGFRQRRNLHVHEQIHTREKFNCNQCEKVFNTSLKLKVHLQIHKGEKPFICNICRKGFVKRTRLRDHMFVHTDQKPYLCRDPDCGRGFISRDLRRHERIHSVNNPFKCGTCGKQFMRQSHLVEHEGIHIPSQERAFPCLECDKRYFTARSLARHSTTHSEIKPFKCSFCSKGFTRKNHLTEHVRTHTGERPFACQFCEKRFSKKGHKNKHERIHTGEKPFSCNDCPKKFTSGSCLKRHQSIHSGEKPYWCEQCDKQFSQPGGLHHHQRCAHTDEKPFKCSKCPKGFTSKSYLAKHEQKHTEPLPFNCTKCNMGFVSAMKLDSHDRKIHLGENPYKCTTCNKVLRSSSDLTRHIRIHTNEKPFPCTELGCGKYFRIKSDLTKHKRIHTGEKPFLCKWCGQRFTGSSHLITHERIHTGEKPYECEYCKRKFNKRCNLNAHVRIHLGKPSRRKPKNLASASVGSVGASGVIGVGSSGAGVHVPLALGSEHAPRKPITMTAESSLNSTGSIFNPSMFP